MPPPCDITVQVGTTCSYTGSVNYVIYGVMSKLCGKSKGWMNNKIHIWKGPVWPFRDAAPNYDQSMLWADAGFDGWPNVPDPPQDPNYAMCSPTCPTKYTSGSFQVYWYPHSWL